MTASSKDQDQSMEEILQSIKRIIADEDEVAPKGSDILELTDMVEEDGTVHPVEPGPAPEPELEDLAKLTIDEIMAKRKEEALEADQAAETAAAPIEPVAPLADDEPLISEETFNAAAAAFDALKNLPDSLPAVPHLDSMHMRSGTTVEDLVLEALRPMLRQWLDSNLAEIVNKLVEREVRKISAR